MSIKKRKEVSLDEETIVILEMKAKREGRNLKNYMEYVLHESAYGFEVTDEYKVMMDKMIEKHEKGKSNYTSWENVKKNMIK